jgi:hypothetical protein
MLNYDLDSLYGIVEKRFIDIIHLCLGFLFDE